ncbi:MAG: hypothetical protein AB1650_09845 [Candidatus Omnitrophota bacterium]
MFNLGLDYDDTITRSPEFFRVLTGAVREAGGTSHLVSSRPDTKESRDNTMRGLDAYGIRIDKFGFFRHSLEEMADICPHQELDPDKKWLWQKIEYCAEHDINIFFDDNEKVIELFSEFLPNVMVFKACKFEINAA